MARPYPVATSAGVSNAMRANRGVDTKPELLVRSALHRRGLRYRKNLAVLAAGAQVRPDVVFTRARLAVFVDGCFWHGCPEHGTSPRSNMAYWQPKLARNRERDRLVDEALIADGWAIVRVWEHEDPGAAADRIKRIIWPARDARSNSNATARGRRKVSRA